MSLLQLLWLSLYIFKPRPTRARYEVAHQHGQAGGTPPAQQMSARLPVRAMWLQVVPYEMYAGAMRLDGPTLGNLEVLATPEGHPQGSLLARIDTCVYPGALCRLV